MVRPPPRVIFVNRYYWPDEPGAAQILTDLATGLAGRGHRVSVIASRPTNTTVPLRETNRDVNVIRVACTRRGGTKRNDRIIDYLSFLLGVRRELSSLAKPGDIIVSLTDPPLLGILVYAIAYLYETRCYHWIHQIYPEDSLVGTRNPFPRLLGKLMLPMRNLAWRKSAGCVTLGHDMAETLVRNGIDPGKITVVPSWAPRGIEPQPIEKSVDLRREWKLEGKFVVAYSGYLGPRLELEVIVEVASLIAGDDDVAFVIVGTGPARPRLEQSVKQRGLRNVQFHGPQPRPRLGANLALADVHLVTLHAGSKDFVFPGKLYSISAVGRPVIFIGPPYSDAARLVTADGYGQAFPREDISGIVAALRALRDDPGLRAHLGEAAAKAAQKGHGLDHAILAWEKELDLTPPPAYLASLGRSSPQ